MDLKTAAPCYLYDKKEIRNACREMKTKLTGFDFLYSVKANPFEQIVRCVADEGFGVDAASPGEVMESLKCGIDPKNIYYSAPGKMAKSINTMQRCAGMKHKDRASSSSSRHQAARYPQAGV